MNNILKNTSLSGKTKWTAILLIFLFGIFGWLYIIKKAAIKFIAGFLILLIILIFLLVTNLSIFYYLLILYSIAIRIWALIDVSIKQDSFYENYPNE